MLALPAAAEICKYADPDGAVHYTNVAPEKGWKKLGCTLGGDDAPVQRSSSSGGSAARGSSASRASPSPANFPRVDAETQRGRDDLRRRVLAEELAGEEKLLAEAKNVYAGGAPVPLPEEKADVEKYRARIARLRQSVTLHEKNIEALKKELAGIR